MNAVQDIKDRLKIEDVVAQYVQLKKAGRSMKGLCPFHAEKTPSFVVSPDRQIAWCFGCNRGGDIFRFVQEVEGIEFSDALKLLADKAGITLADYAQPQIGGGAGGGDAHGGQGGRAGKTSGDQKELLREVYEKVTVYYEQQLWSTPEGAKVLDYLRKRGATDESIREFRLGFAPDSFEATHLMLLKAGYTKQLLVSAGLAMTRETTVEKIYDRFRGRLMFPIWNHLGRVVAFGGRALSKEQEPKYMNSPETALYHKSKILYGFYQGKAAIKSEESALLVEGYMDVIMAHQAGVRTAVAPCGTALASPQLRLLKPFASTIVLAFDNDSAGREAARRAFELAQEFDFVLKVLVVPGAKDPAEYVLNNRDALQGLVQNAQPYGDFLFSYLQDAYGLDDATAKRKIVQEFLPFFSSLQNSIVKDEYVRKLAYGLDIKEVQIYDEISKFKLPSHHPARNTPNISAVPQQMSLKRRIDESVLGLFIEFPRIGRLFVEQAAQMAFSEDLKPIYKAFADQYNVDGLKTAKDVIDEFPHELREKAALLSLAAGEYYGEMSEETVEKEIAALLNTARKTSLSEQKQVLWKRLREAEEQQNATQREELLQQLNELNRNAVL